MESRTTVIVGAGLPLNLSLPEDIIFPSTGNITQAVISDYPDYSKFNTKTTPLTDIARQFYDFLCANYPICGKGNGNINFEQVFHCMESYLSFAHSWSDSCYNVDICPVFGPFTAPSKIFDVREISSVMPLFLLRIMDIVNGYNNYFESEKLNREKWLTDFILSLGTIDIFNFNYDTLFENIYGDGGYEDGFEYNPDTKDYQIFSPSKLMNCQDGKSTVNHLHGCINYNHPDNPNKHINDLRFEDWVKYPNYAEARKRMIGRSQSQPRSQTKETIYNGPIITGLNKTAKLNCVPFDFYHANLINSITHNNKLLIIGYSFGDYYCNQLIQRMNLIHGKNARVCIIDYFNLIENSRFGFNQYVSDYMSQDFGNTLCIYSDTTMFTEALTTLQPLDKTVLMKSPSGRLMLGADGLCSAANQKDDIITFLNS